MQKRRALAPHADSALVRKAKKDSQAFDALYEKYQRRVYRYISRRLQRHPELAEDLTQETFARAMSGLARFRIQEYSYCTYLFKIARNLLINRYKKRKETALEKLRHEPVDEKADVQEYVAKHIERETMQRIIKTLPVSQQMFVRLRFEQQLSMREIAKRAGKSENAVKLALGRAKKKLHSLLGETSRPRHFF